MTAKNQRLVLAGLALLAVAAAALLALVGLRSQASFFYSPSDLAAAHVAPDQAVRLGGMVSDGSVARLPDGVTTRFVVTDRRRTVGVTYRGILPDLFREGSGVVAEGHLARGGRFIADTILAKHDERYMPPQVAGAMHETTTLAR